MSEARFKGPLHLGKTGLVMREAPASSGSKEVTFTTDAESILISLYASSVSGTLDVEVWTVGADGEELKVITFPQLSSSTSELVLRKAAATLDNVRVRAAYSDAAEFDIRAKGIGTGDLSVQILGQSEARASQEDVGTAPPTLLIAASLTDRAGMIIKNFSSTETLYVGFTEAETTASNGYPLSPGESLGLDVASGQEVYGVSSSGTIDTRLMEAGG